eukprot:GHVS01001021.1.p1 GENE.GHVS01001021.1~~GHVS01001021.1.p1  ORF type:complete len:228 (+),score=8.55 GHVS01001021.1:618-1301(+)
MKFKEGNCWIVSFGEIDLSFAKICCRCHPEKDWKLFDACEGSEFAFIETGDRRFIAKKNGEKVFVNLYPMTTINTPTNVFHELMKDIFTGQQQMLEISQILSVYGRGDRVDTTGSPVLEIAVFTFCAFQSFGGDLLKIVSLLNIEGLSFTIKPSMHGGPPYFYCSWNSHATKRRNTFIYAKPIINKYHLHNESGALKLRTTWKMKVVKAIKTQCDKELEDIRKAVAP